MADWINTNKQHAALMAAQAAYGNQIRDWLRKHFPQWNTDHGNRTHPAAITAVIRLHHQHGKGKLTVREHGPAIRSAVDGFEKATGS